MSLKDRSALVTGGANGIGKATARALLSQGCKVNIVDVEVDDLTKTLQEFQDQFGQENVTSCTADVTSDNELRYFDRGPYPKLVSPTASFDHSISLFGTLDIVINNAGIVREGQWERMVDINLSGVVRGTDLGVEFISSSKGGVIVNISSTAGTEDLLSNDPFYIAPVYSATKAGVLAFSRCMAASKEVQEKRIQICCLCPVATVSKATTNITADTARDEQAFRAAIAAIAPLSADFVGETIASLVEREDVNGQIAVVDAKCDLSFYK